jgi:hypothetical protein
MISFTTHCSDKLNDVALIRSLPSRFQFPEISRLTGEPVPKLIDCALTRTVRTSGSMGQALAVFQAFSLAKLRIFRTCGPRLLFQN